jgi:hypothetical protein
MAKIVDYSNATYLELEEDSDISIASIANWFRNNFSLLNNILNKNYSLNLSLEIVDENAVEIGEEEVVIFKQLYFIYFYGRKARKFLGAAGTDSVIELSSDGGTVRMINKIDLAKNYSSLLKESKDTVKNLINAYKIKQYQPQQVTGDDITNITNLHNSLFERQFLKDGGHLA